MFEKVFFILFVNKGNFGLNIFSFLFLISNIICLSESILFLFNSSSLIVATLSSSSSVVSSFNSFSFCLASSISKNKSSFFSLFSLNNIYSYFLINCPFEKIRFKDIVLMPIWFGLFWKVYEK